MSISSEPGFALASEKGEKLLYDVKLNYEKQQAGHTKWNTIPDSPRFISIS